MTYFSRGLMAKLRKACAYRKIERPYTRKSKYTKKSYIRSKPHNFVVKFDQGNLSKNFPVKIELLSKSDLQIRSNALESARKSCNRFLEKNLTVKGYHFRIKKYPHHVLRENPLASGAGADRMSTGMKMSFGKSIGVSAQVKKGDTIIEIGIEKKDLEIGKIAAKKAGYKFACETQIKVTEVAL